MSEEHLRRRLGLAAVIVASAVVFTVVFGAHLRGVPEARYVDRDDAVITLSHARNLVEYGFIGVSPSGERIEGFSAPLQFLIATAIYKAFPFDYPTFFRWQTRIGTVALGAVFAWLLAWRAVVRASPSRVVFAGVAIVASAQILASSTAFLLWHASGMENVYKSVALLALVAAFDAMLENGRILWPVALLVPLAAITRIDAVVPVAMLLGAFVVLWQIRHRNARALLFALAGLAPWVAFMVWRREYFGEWSPNTAAAQAISVGARVAAAARSPLGAFADYSDWLGEVGKALFSFQLLWLIPLAWYLRRDTVAVNRLVVITVGTLACLAQYVLFGPARMDSTRTVTELALYATAALPFVLLGSGTFTRTHVAAGLAAVAVSVALAATGPEYRLDIGWGTTSFEAVADTLTRIAAANDIPRPLIANPDLGAVSWRKQFNIVDFGRLGSTVVPRTPLPNVYIAAVREPDIVELHAPWSCVYRDLFSTAAFVTAYARLTPVDPQPECPGQTGRAPSYWMRRDVMKDSASPERAFLDRFRKTLDVHSVEMELASCLEKPGPRPCAYVGQTLFRFVPELKRAGHEGAIAVLLGRDPRLRIEHAFFTSSQDPQWWKSIGVTDETVTANPLRSGG